MDSWSSADKRNALLGSVIVGSLLLWSFSRVRDVPVLPTWKDAVPRTQGQKSGFPSKSDLADDQPAVQSNQGEAPSYTANSNFGK